MLQEGLNVTAIGISVVFVLLTLLVGIIYGMSSIARVIEAMMPAAPDTATGSAPARASNQELVSVIGAAIAAHRKRR